MDLDVKKMVCFLRKNKMENAILLMIGLWLFSLIAVVGEYLFGEKK